MNLDHALFAVCDGRKGALYRASIDDANHLQLTCMQQFASRWTDFHEHHRPDALGRGPSANAAQHFADSAQETEEMERRFARELASQFRAVRRVSNVDPMVVFAAPRMLGELRRELVHDSGFLLRRGELTCLRPSELAAHPLVTAAVRGILHTALLAPKLSSNTEEVRP